MIFILRFNIYVIHTTYNTTKVCRFSNTLQHCKNDWHPTKHDVRLLTCCDNKGTGALPVFPWKIKHHDNYHTWPDTSFDNHCQRRTSQEKKRYSPARPADDIPFLYCTYHTEASHSLLFFVHITSVAIACLGHHLPPHPLELVFFILQLLPST